MMFTLKDKMKVMLMLKNKMRLIGMLKNKTSLQLFQFHALIMFNKRTRGYNNNQ